MSTAQNTYIASVQTATAALIAARAAAEAAKQSTIAAKTYVVGWLPGFPTSDAAAHTAIVSAGATQQSSLATANGAASSSITTAKDVLKNSSGEYGY